METAPRRSFQASGDSVNANAQKKTSKKKTNLQMEAYVKWRDTSVQGWLMHLGQGEMPPNKAQNDFLSCVVERCTQEHRSLGGRKKSSMKDEPLRCCLMGIPGAGKSTASVA